MFSTQVDVYVPSPLGGEGQGEGDLLNPIFIHKKRHPRSGHLAPAGSQEHDNPDGLEKKDRRGTPELSEPCRNVPGMTCGREEKRKHQAVGNRRQAHDLVDADLAVAAIVGPQKFGEKAPDLGNEQAKKEGPCIAAGKVTNRQRKKAHA